MAELGKGAPQQGLGKGLSALFSDTRVSRDDDANANRIIDIPIDEISAGENQPRTTFDDDKIKELAASIKENGLLQPVMLYRDGDGKFRLIAGERRWRACKLLGVRSIQAIVRSADGARLAELSIIENIQREDLTIIEEATAYKKLQKEYDYTQELLAQRLGKSRAHVANTLRLLNLPENIQDLVNEGKITGGHARALLTSERPMDIAQQIIGEKLSVRDTERLVKKGGNRDSDAPGDHTDAAKRAIKRTLQKDMVFNVKQSDGFKESEHPEILALKSCMQKALGLETVLISYDEDTDSGSTLIAFSSLEELDVIMQAARLYAEEKKKSNHVDEDFDNNHVEEDI